MQKPPQAPNNASSTAHEMQLVYGAVAGNGGVKSARSPDEDLSGGFACRDKDREEWGAFDRERAPNGRSSRAFRGELSGGRPADYAPDHHDYQNQYNHQHHGNHNQPPSPYHSYHNHHQPGPRRYPVGSNGSPYFPEEVYDNEYVSHTDGSMISRREWYV